MTHRLLYYCLGIDTFCLLCYSLILKKPAYYAQESIPIMLRKQSFLNSDIEQFSKPVNSLDLLIPCSSSSELGVNAELELL